LPSNHLEDPPFVSYDDPTDRDCARAAAAVPRAAASYDVRVVINDVLDRDSFLELKSAYAFQSRHRTRPARRANCRCDRVSANAQRGSLDIDAAQKAARLRTVVRLFQRRGHHVRRHQRLPTGSRPEWRGIIRHGAQLLHAYATATVPACASYSARHMAAHIVMDSRGLGTDWCVAWPTAEIAVMGAQPAVGVLYRRTLNEIAEPAERVEEERARERSTRTASSIPMSPPSAATSTTSSPPPMRRALAAALERLSTARAPEPRRRH
jgi:propionyl-CoA carboxylase beta chain